MVVAEKFKPEENPFKAVRIEKPEVPGTKGVVPIKVAKAEIREGGRLTEKQVAEIAKSMVAVFKDAEKMSGFKNSQLHELLFV
jgi:hypothetical protein